MSFKTRLKTVGEKLRSTEPKSEFHSIRLTVESLQIFKYYINQSFSKSTRIINYSVGTALLGMLGPWRSVAVIISLRAVITRRAVMFCNNIQVICAAFL